MFLLLHSAFAATLAVPDDHPTISEAITAADSGDEITVAAGSYSENLVIDKDLIITGSGSESTELSAPDTIITITDATVELSGFSLLPTGTRGILQSGGELTVRDLRFNEAAQDDHGGAIYVDEGVLTVEDSTFNDSDVGEYNGGHIYALGGELTAINSTFGAGRGEKGGAIYSYDTDVYLDTCAFSNNEGNTGDATGRGGAIRAEYGTVTVIESSFATNSCDVGFGGAISSYRAPLEVEGSSFTGNVVGGAYGGAVAVWDTDATITNSTFVGNQADILEDGDLGHGGAIVHTGDSAGRLVIDRSVFQDNAADGYGGAIRMYGGEIEVSDSTFTSNSADSGGVWYSSSAEHASFAGSTFRTNAATYGGALRWRPNDTTASFSLSDSVFDDNDADSFGGAIAGYVADSMTVLDSEFTNNRAPLGGAVYANGVSQVELRRNLFCANTAQDSDGGAVVSYLSGEHDIRNNVFVENSAAEWGGGLHLRENDNASVINNSFLGNTSDSRAMGASFYETPGEFRNNLVMGHQGAEIAAVDSESAPEMSADYNLFYDNQLDLDDWLADEHGESRLSEDPQLVGWSADRDCSNDALYPLLGSPLIDAGDPAILDLDGSVSDIGATGGEDPDSDYFTDADEDGWTLLYDCDDEDPDTNPDATEIPYDGVDQDCDGYDLVDVDGDGVDGDGGDCDDEDASVYPGAEDAWYDGVDSDCGGEDDYDADGDGYAGDGGPDCDDDDPAVNPEAEEQAGDAVDSDCDGELDPPSDAPSEEECGCAQTGPAPGPVLALFGLMVLRRRRR